MRSRASIDADAAVLPIIMRPAEAAAADGDADRNEEDVDEPAGEPGVDVALVDEEEEEEGGAAAVAAAAAAAAAVAAEGDSSPAVPPPGTGTRVTTEMGRGGASFPCDLCPQVCKSKHGLTLHTRVCAGKSTEDRGKKRRRTAVARASAASRASPAGLAIGLAAGTIMCATWRCYRVALFRECRGAGCFLSSWCCCICAHYELDRGRCRG